MKNIVRHYLLTTAYQRRGAGVLSQTPEPNRSKHPMQRRFFFNYELKFRLPHIFWLIKTCVHTEARTTRALRFFW